MYDMTWLFRTCFAEWDLSDIIRLSGIISYNDAFFPYRAKMPLHTGVRTGCHYLISLCPSVCLSVCPSVCLSVYV